jgi:hypothetical protein
MANLQLNNVHFYFTRIQEPQDGYQTTDDLKKKYQVTVAVDKAQYNDYKAKYPKNAGKGGLEPEDFVKKYGPVPKEFEGQPLIYTLKVDVKAFRFDKEKEQVVPMNEIYRPRVYQMIDNVQTDVTMEKLVGNGSKGHLSYYEYEYTFEGKKNIAPRLAAILVTDLVEFERKENPITSAHKFI